MKYNVFVRKLMDNATQSLIFIIRNRAFGKKFPVNFDFCKFSKEEKDAEAEELIRRGGMEAFALICESDGI